MQCFLKIKNKSFSSDLGTWREFTRSILSLRILYAVLSQSGGGMSGALPQIPRCELSVSFNVYGGEGSQSHNWSQSPYLNHRLTWNLFFKQFHCWLKSSRSCGLVPLRQIDGVLYLAFLWQIASHAHQQFRSS